MRERTEAYYRKYIEKEEEGWKVVLPREEEKGGK